MAIGRIGDIINGEHFAKATSLAWGVIYTHPGSQALQRPATHPAVAYELLFDLALVAVLWPLRNRLRPGGMLFTLYVAMYAMGRFFLSFLREEFNEYFLGLDQAQIIALGVMLITIPLLAYKAKLVQTTRQRTVRRRAAGKGGTPSA